MVKRGAWLEAFGLEPTLAGNGVLQTTRTATSQIAVDRASERGGKLQNCHLTARSTLPFRRASRNGRTVGRLKAARNSPQTRAESQFSAVRIRVLTNRSAGDSARPRRALVSASVRLVMAYARLVASTRARSPSLAIPWSRRESSAPGPSGWRKHRRECDGFRQSRDRACRRPPKQSPGSAGGRVDPAFGENRVFQCGGPHDRIGPRAGARADERYGDQAVTRSPSSVPGRAGLRDKKRLKQG